MTYLLRIACALSLSSSIGCGGSVVTSDATAGPFADAAVKPDASDAAKLPDGTVDASVIITDTSVVDKVAIDSPPGEFCSGDAPKVLFHGATLSPAMTTSQLIMDCCEGAYIRFHTNKELGFNLEVMVQGFVWMTPGSYVVNDEPGAMQVRVGKHADFGNASDARGTVRVDTAVPDPMKLGFCIETDADGALGAMKLYVPQVLVAPYSWQNRFELRLLSDPTITAEAALKMPLGTLALAANAAVDVMSLAYYEQSTHSADWDVWSSTESFLSILPPVGVFGLPFVVVADGQRIYLGAYTTLVSSVMIDAPTIAIESMTKEGFRIEPPPNAPDPRSDPRILQVLSNLQKLAP
jgi:hypothetical protein